MDKNGRLKEGQSRCVKCGKICTHIVKEGKEDIPYCDDCVKE